MKSLMRIAGGAALVLSTLFGAAACGGGGSGQISITIGSQKSLALEARGMSTHRILLTWEGYQSEPDSFIIQRSEDGMQYVTISSVDGHLRFYSDFDLQRGQTRFYRIRTQVGGLVSAPSEAVVASTLDRSIASSSTSEHSLALKADGTVWAWGSNDEKQIGPFFYSWPDNYPGAYQIKYDTEDPLEDIVAIATGASHSLALRADGMVLAWGSNSSGQLGIGSYSFSTPTQVLTGPSMPLDHIVAIAAGENFSLALRADSTVWAWGKNNHGQLGKGDFYLTTKFAEKVELDQTTPLSKIVAIAAGKLHALALTSDGTVFAWGTDEAGQLGYENIVNTSPVASHTPNLVMADSENPLEEIVSISAGLLHSLALTLQGTVLAWGGDVYGQLGDGEENSSDQDPVVVVTEEGSPLDGVVSISSGGRHNLALRNDGTLWSWGYGNQGQLGIGTGSPYSLMVPLEAGSVDFAQGGAFHSLVMVTDGTICSWGKNLYGSLGSGSVSEQLFPVEVLKFETSIPFSLYD